jgi:hypothetical protein
MPTPVPVDLLLEFNLNDLLIETISTPAPMTNLGAGSVQLPDDAALWVEVGFTNIGDDAYDAYIVSGSMAPEWMNGFNYVPGSPFVFFYAFPRTVYGNPSYPEIGVGYQFPPDAISYVGVNLPADVPLEDLAFEFVEQPDGDGGWAFQVITTPAYPLSESQLEQFRFYITATQGTPGPEPVQDFWTSFVGAREIL